LFGKMKIQQNRTSPEGSFDARGAFL
jgi:hypothetical protein